MLLLLLPFTALFTLLSVKLAFTRGLKLLLLLLVLLEVVVVFVVALRE